jgi:thioredoxin-related protein
MSEELCPFCEMIKAVLRDMESTDNYQRKFDILHSVVDQVKEFGYKDGYTTALMEQIESMNGLVEDILEDDCECKN